MWFTSVCYVQCIIILILDWSARLILQYLNGTLQISANHAHLLHQVILKFVSLYFSNSFFHLVAVMNLPLTSCVHTLYTEHQGAIVASLIWSHTKADNLHHLSIPHGRILRIIPNDNFFSALASLLCMAGSAGSSITVLLSWPALHSWLLSNKATSPSIF